MSNSLTVPKRGEAARMLADLNAEHAPPQEVPTEEPLRTSTSAHLRKQVDAQLLEQARNHASNQGSEQSSKAVSTRSLKEVSAPVSEGARNQGSTQSREHAKLTSEDGSPAEETIEETVRTALLLKRNHTGGTKASVDMDPALMKRIKRYCLDNGDPAARILFIELVTAFLDKEGY